MKRILNWLIALFLILNCNTIYTAEINKNDHFKEILLILVIIKLIIQIRNQKEKKIKKSTLMSMIFCIGYMVTYLLVRMPNMGDLINYIFLYLLLFNIFILAFSISEKNKLIKEILNELSNVATILAVISLVFYFLTTVFHIVKPTGTVMINFGKERAVNSYYNMHFDTQNVLVFGTKITRNTGIFVEAPMFNLILTIALAIELLFKTKASKFKVIIFLITIITTISTTGMVLSIILLIAKFVFSNDNNKVKKYIKFLMIPFIIFVGIYVIFSIMGEKVDTESYKTRMSDYRVCFLAWKDNPIFGSGYNNKETIVRYMSEARLKASNTGLSNSILTLLAQGGIYMLIFYIIPAIKMIRYGIKNKNNNIIIFTLTIVALFITTIFLYKPIMIFLLAIGYAFNTNEENNLNEIKGVENGKI